MDRTTPAFDDAFDLDEAMRRLSNWLVEEKVVGAESDPIAAAFNHQESCSAACRVCGASQALTHLHVAKEEEARVPHARRWANELGRCIRMLEKLRTEEEIFRAAWKADEEAQRPRFGEPIMLGAGPSVPSLLAAVRSLEQDTDRAYGLVSRTPEGKPPRFVLARVSAAMKDCGFSHQEIADLLPDEVGGHSDPAERVRDRIRKQQW